MASVGEPSPTDAGIRWIVAEFGQLLGNCHGDRVVGMALFNHDAGIGVSPLGVLHRLRQLKLEPAELWGIFKSHGGRSKEDTGIPEGDQHQALRGTWEELVSRQRSNQIRRLCW